MTVPVLPGRLRVVGSLGAGAFATVWLAYDPALDAEVAVKVLADNWSRRPEVHARFLEEGRMLRRVESERVVRVYYVGELADGRPYLVMTHAAGGSLAGHLEGGGAVDVESALMILGQVVEGLEVLHSKGIVHRDVNPHNVLLLEPWTPGSAPRVVLADLGLAKDLGLGSGLTQPAGTGRYRAPEQRELSTEVSPATDTYGVSVLARELLTRAGVPTSTGLALMAAGTNEHPAERPSARELLDQLRADLTAPKTSSSSTAPSRGTLIRRRWIIGGAAAAMLATVAVATSGLWPRTYAGAVGGLSVRLGSGWTQIESASMPGVKGAPGFTLSQDAARIVLSRAPAGQESTSADVTDVIEQTTHDECSVQQPSSVDVGGWRGRLVTWSSCGSSGSGRVDEVALTVGDDVVYVQVTAPAGEPDLGSVLTGLVLAPR